MKSTGILNWIGIVLVSLLLGQVVGMISSQALDQIISMPGPSNFSDEYGKRLIVIGHLQLLVFIWVTLASATSLGCGSRIRFHLLYLHSLAAICVSFYLAVHFHDEIKSLDRFNRNDFLEIWQIAGPESFLLLFFIILGVLLFLSALIVDKDEQRRQRNFQRQNRNFTSDGHRPPLQ